MKPQIPHRLIPEGWPIGHQWEVRLTVNNLGYVIYCVTQHVRTRDPNGKKCRPVSFTVHSPVMHGDEVLEMIRMQMIDAAVGTSQQLELAFG